MSTRSVVPRRCLALLGAAVVLAGCSGSSSEPPGTTADAAETTSLPDATDPTTADPTTADPTTADPTTSAPIEASVPSETLADCPNRPTGSSAAEVTDDGVYAALVSSFDPGANEVNLDVVQFLVGQEAADAYEAETGDDSGVPNDYWVTNENPAVRTLPVAADARVWLVRLAQDSAADVSTGTFDELSAYLDDGADGAIWWVTLQSGAVTELCEQFTP